MNKNIILWLECSAIFIATPFILWLRVIDIQLITVPLVLICIPAIFWLGKEYGFKRSLFWRGEKDAERQQLIVIINRFLLISIVLFVILFVFYPLHLFDLPLKQTKFWLLLLLLYPVVAVYPQELLYRTYFFNRYEKLLRNRLHLTILNALLFGWMHIVFHNLLAIVFSIVAGFLFADTYNKSRSLRLTCFEHSLYGYLIFTFGYGEAFLYAPWIHSIN